MVRGWRRILLLVVALGIFIAFASPYIPDPLSFPGKKAIAFIVVLLIVLLPHALLTSTPLRVAWTPTEHSAPERLALICSRLI
jgi:cation transport ATPase